MTFWETITSAEYVMFESAVLLIITIIIWCVRGVRLSRNNKGNRQLMERVKDLVMEGDIDNARRISMSSKSPGAALIETGLSNMGRPMAEVETAMSQCLEIRKETLSNGIVWLRFIAIAAPLTALGGTLTGIIDRLRDLGESATPVDMNILCAKIAPTIVTTVAGLGVGVLALLAIACLASQIKSNIRNLKELKLEFTNLLNSPS